MKKAIGTNRMKEIINARHIIGMILKSKGYRFDEALERNPLTAEIFFDAHKKYHTNGIEHKVTQEINIVFINDHYKITITPKFDGELLYNISSRMESMYQEIENDLLNYFGKDGEFVFILLDDEDELQDYRLGK